MSTRNVPLGVPGPFHVSNRCINREWFRLPMELVWEIYSRHLHFLSYSFQFQIHNFVLMDNHTHMLVSTPKCNLAQGMGYFNREVSRDLNRCGNRINRTFAGRYHRSYINSYHYYVNCYKYVYQNPLRAGIVERAEHYPYSTLFGKLGQGHLLIPVVEDLLLFGNVSSELEWLNTLPNKEDEEVIRKGLRKSRFALSRDRNTNGPHRLEMERL